MSLLLLMDDTPTPAYDLNFMGGMPAGLTYTNSSTERVYWDSTGTRRSAVANEPIFETLGGVAQGMRWEMEQRQNLATNSEGAAATWTANNVTDAGTSITGFSASLQFGDNSLGRSAYKAVSMTNAVTYSVSVFVVMDDGSRPVINTDMSIVIAGNIAASNLLVTRVAGNLYRISGSGAATSTAALNNGVIKLVSYSAKTFRIAGIQVEAAASASSYIPTAGSAVIRQPDVLTASSISPWYRQDEGTVVFEGISNAVDGVDRGCYVFSDGTTGNRILAAKSPANALNQFVASAGVSQFLQSLSTISVGSVFRSALSYKLNDSNAAANGVIGTTDTAVTVPTITQLRFGCAIPSGTQTFMGYARRFQYYRNAFPDPQLQGLSRV